MKSTSKLVVLALSLFIAVFSISANTAMYILLQDDSPAGLIETTHTLTDFLSSAKLRNNGPKTIVGYKIAYAVREAFPEKTKFVLKMGEWMNVPAGIQPAQIIEVPAQMVPVRLAKQTDSIHFLVAELKFDDGSSWKASFADVLKRISADREQKHD